MTHAYGDCRQVEMQLVPADAETDFSLSNSSVVAPGQRLSEHLSQPERSSTEGRQLVPADALVIEKENGEWPEWITDVDGPIWYQCGGTYGLLDDIVEAIAERAKAELPKDPWDYDP